MACIELAPEALDDFDRLLQHLAQFEIEDGLQRVVGVIQSLQVLARSPLVGRPTRGGKWKLVVGKGLRGYVVLYRFVATVDVVFVLAIRSQRESGYQRG